MLTMIYMTRIQNMSVFLLKVNNPSIRHLVWPRLAPVWPPSGTSSGPRLAPIGHPRLAPVWPPSGTSSGPRLAPVWSPSGPRLVPVWPPSALPSGPVRPDLAPSLASLKGINLLKFA
jgi:hypothetical protein